MSINWVPNKKINKNLVEKLFKRTIESNHFTNYGPNVQLLEETIKNKLEIINTKTVIVVSNASVGIQCLAKSIELFHKKKINWATQSFTFPPSAQGILHDTKILSN